MVTNITIPPAALEAAVSAYNYASSDCYTTQEQDMGTAIAAALSAWPNAFEYRSAHANYGQCLSLPLPQEASDDQ